MKTQNDQKKSNDDRRELTLEDLASVRVAGGAENKGPLTKVNGVEGTEGKLGLSNHNEVVVR